MISAAGYENGSEGLKFLNDSTLPGLLLLDRMMPIMSGAEFLEILQNNPAHSSTPLVVMTAKAQIKKRAPQMERPFQILKLWCELEGLNL